MANAETIMARKMPNIWLLLLLSTIDVFLFFILAFNLASIYDIPESNYTYSVQVVKSQKSEKVIWLEEISIVYQSKPITESKGMS